MLLLTACNQQPLAIKVKLASRNKSLVGFFSVRLSGHALLRRSDENATDSKEACTACG